MTGCDYLLSVDQFSAFYGYQRVLSDLSFRLPEGTAMGLVGPNGAGKSTLIKALLGLVSAQGSVRFDNQLLYNPQLDTDVLQNIRPAIGYLPEVTGFYPYLSCREYVMMIGNLLGLDRPTTEKKLAILFDYFSLNRWEGHLISQLSKGNKQRLSLVVTFMQEPKLLLLDEPFSGLAPGGRSSLKDIIKRFTTTGIPEIGVENPGSVLFSSHSLTDIDQLCNRILMMDASGKIVWQGDLTSNSTAGMSLEERYLSLIRE